MKLTDFITITDVEAHIIGKSMMGRIFPALEDREAWANVPEALQQAWVTQAESYLNYEWPSLRATAFMAYFEEGSRKPYDSVEIERRSALCTLLIAECIDGKGRFLREITNLIWLLCEETTWCAPAHHYLSLRPGEILSDVEEPLFDLSAGETAALLAWTSHLLKSPLDEISPFIRERIRVELERRIITPYTDRNDFWWMGFGEREVNNWNPWCNANMLTVLLLQELEPEWKLKLFDKVLRSLDRYIEVQFEDGGCDEGSTYWARAAGMLLVNLELLYRASDGALQVYDQPLIRKLGQFVSNMHIDDHYYVNFADGSAIASQDYSMIHLYGSRIQDDQLRALGQIGFRSYQVSDRKGKGISFFQEMISLHSFASIHAEAALEPPLVQDVWLPNLQVMAAREMEGSSQGLFVAIKGGHNGESHNHNDIGHFVVYVNGKPFLIDIGVETYTQKTFSPQRYEIWTMQSGYHSVPVIHGYEQKEGRSFRAEDVTYAHIEAAVRFEVELASAYPDEAGVQSWHRSLTLHRGLNPSVELRESCLFVEPTDQVLLHIMSSQLPRHHEQGQIRLQDHANNQLILFYEHEQWEAVFEHITITDESLVRVWGDSLHRIQFKLRHAVQQGSWVFRMSEQ
ncbi:heparinase II/III domain-containing protein [Paenibacillus qinlingensis]|uniref:heparinase II/III domain-containing protein n=1 Tax=Paenibacillus qinlingensis TaxID=1837343 RepID=UPI001563CBCA|nr:heparinase II/III family protein [Paenibacillus qinlingensis]NQX64343.1 heparinase II/III family protein [Paenibacillus qinlingensis]